MSAYSEDQMVRLQLKGLFDSTHSLNEVTEHHETAIGEISVQVSSFLSFVHVWTLITS